jgi:hypothetical protein
MLRGGRSQIAVPEASIAAPVVVVGQLMCSHAGAAKARGESSLRSLETTRFPAHGIARRVFPE